MTEERLPPQSAKIAKIAMRTVEIKSINPATYNPRIDLKPGDPEYEKIKNSLVGFGYVDPLILNEHNNVLVSGHQRLKILLEQGYTHADVSIVKIPDPMKEKSMNMAMNNIRGREDAVKLKAIFVEFGEFDERIALAGYEQEEFENVRDFEEEVDTGEIGKTPAERKTVYDAGAIKQIVLYFTGPEYEDVVARLSRISSALGLENNTEVFMKVLESYEQNNSKKN